MRQKLSFFLILVSLVGYSVAGANLVRASTAEDVTNLYKTILGRDPDPAGFSFYADRLNSGTSIDVIKQEIAGSPEAQARYEAEWQENYDTPAAVAPTPAPTPVPAPAPASNVDNQGTSSAVPSAGGTPILQLSIGGYANNGGEQTQEANTLSSQLAQYGVLTDVQGGSSYRNSSYTIEAAPNVNFVVNGQNLGSTITIVHKQDWLGIATNDCSGFGDGYLEGRQVNDSGCNYAFTSGRSDSTLSAVIVSCSAGQIGVYPNCITPTATPVCTPPQTGTPPNCKNPCSFNGTTNWGSGCSGSYNGTVSDGESATVSNSASGYNGSASFTCSNGNWENTGSTCQSITTPQVCTYNGTVNWGSGCSGTLSSSRAASGSSVTVSNSASGYGGSASFTCSNGSWNNTSSTCDRSGVCSVPLVNLLCPETPTAQCPSGKKGTPPNCTDIIVITNTGPDTGTGGTGGTGQGTQTSCSSGYILQNGSCVPDGCASGYTRSSFTAQCVRDFSDDNDGNNTPAPTCNDSEASNFRATGSCSYYYPVSINAGVAGFDVQPPRTRVSTSALFSWSASGTGVSCTITGGGITPITGGKSGSNVPSSKLMKIGNLQFTLNCSNKWGYSDSRSVQVQVIDPSYREF